jgi:hypothetical protein
MGKLQFIANATRPNIAYAISRLLSYTANLTMQHISVLKCVLRYSASKNRSSVLNFLIVLEITQELERVRI